MVLHNADSALLTSMTQICAVSPEKITSLHIERGFVLCSLQLTVSVVALSLHTSQHECGFLLPSVLATDLPK